MRKLLCRIGLHDWNRSRSVEALGHTMILVSEQAKCKSCGDTYYHSTQRSIKG